MDALTHDAPLSSLGPPTINGPQNQEYFGNASTNSTNANLNQGINVLCWNIRGITDKIFDVDTQDILFKNDIIILTETHTEMGSEKYYNVIPNFRYHDFPRKFKHRNAPKASGGIGIFIHNDLQLGINITMFHESIIMIKLKAEYFSAQQNIHILCAYFPPADSSYNHNTNSRTDYFNILQEALSSVEPQDEIIICGDLNARTGSLADIVEYIEGSNGALSEILSPHSMSNTHEVPKRHTVDSVVNDYGKELINVCRSVGLCIMNGRTADAANNRDFTCYKTIGASVVDYVICKLDSIPLVDKLILLPKRPESDHRPIYCKLKLHQKLNNQSEMIQSNAHVQCQYKWDHRKIAAYQNSFDCEEVTNLEYVLADKLSQKDINGSVLGKTLNEYINSAVKNVFQRKRGINNKFPVNSWFNDECKIAKKLVTDYANKYDITKVEHAEEYRQLERNYSRIKQREKRNHTEEIRCKLENFSAKDPSSYWKMWKSLKHNSVNNSTLTLSDFEVYFKSQVYPPEMESFDTKHMEEIKDFVTHYDINKDHLSCRFDPQISQEICDAPITPEEVKVHLNKLKNNKAAGNDGLIAEFIKYAPDKIISVLCSTFNRIFTDGDWPDSWCEGLISPIHKKDSINKTDNYRKVTVMPVLGKLLESILNTRLQYKNVVLELDDNHQFGFKENCRTSDNAFILHSLISRQKFKNKPLFTCFVDFTKAFDYVNRSALYYKLIHRGVNGKMLKLICDMYNKAKCRVKWKGKVGGEIESEYGVLQGGMCSPKLFTEFLHDLEEYLDNQAGTILGSKIVTYMLYADDLVLCSDSDVGLQTLINGLFEFCKKWHLIVSLTKTNVVIFGKHNSLHTFNYGRSEIEIVNKYKYLGTIFSSESNIFKMNIKNLAESAQRAVYSLNGYIKATVKYLQPSLAMKMFDAQVSPILEYSSEIWLSDNKGDIAEIEKVHLQFMKSLLKIKPSTCTTALYAELGRFPMKLKMQIRMLKYWQRVLDLPVHHIVRKSYESLLELNDLGQKNWCTHVFDILKSVSFEHIWQTQTMTNRDLLQVKEKLYTNFSSQCMTSINDTNQLPKLRTYKTFKKEFKLEPYLSSPLNPHYTLALTRFRISSHCLAIETGRYTHPKTPEEKRLCIYCPNKVVENEVHFLIDCPNYTQERTEFLNAVSAFIPNLAELDSNNKFIKILSSKTPEVLHYLGKFIYKSFEKRASGGETVEASSASVSALSSDSTA